MPVFHHLFLHDRDIQGILHPGVFREIAKDASHDICRLKTKPIYNRAFGPGELRQINRLPDRIFLAEEFPGHALRDQRPFRTFQAIRIAGHQLEAKDLGISRGDPFHLLHIAPCVGPFTG